jgi:hypothetical protein
MSRDAAAMRGKATIRDTTDTAILFPEAAGFAVELQVASIADKAIPIGKMVSMRCCGGTKPATSPRVRS